MQTDVHHKKANSLPPPLLILNGTVLSQVSSYKYLGVTFTSNLSWTPHITNCCNKTRRLIGLLYRRFYQHTNPSSLLKLYRSFFRSHLEYASIVWNPHLKGEIDALEKVQKFALWVCLKSWDSGLWRTSTAKLLSLQERRVHASLCHLYKGLTDFTDSLLEPKVHR